LVEAVVCLGKGGGDGMTFHITIQTERRTQPERMAQSILDQLHTHSYAGLPVNLSDPQFVMVAEWDGVSPYVICHKGDYSARTMEFYGWPDMTKEQFDAIPAADPVA
jgi:hypothetical protein